MSVRKDEPGLYILCSHYTSWYAYHTVLYIYSGTRCRAGRKRCDLKGFGIWFCWLVDYAKRLHTISGLRRVIVQG
jgi:hypothetical protein